MEGKRKRKWFIKCIVPNCQSNNNSEKENVFFHRFPSNIAKTNEWLQAMDLNINPIDAIKKQMKICSLHFEDSMYVSPNARRFLTRNAKPTLLIASSELSSQISVKLCSKSPKTLEELLCENKSLKENYYKLKKENELLTQQLSMHYSTWTIEDLENKIKQNNVNKQ